MDLRYTYIFVHVTCQRAHTRTSYALHMHVACRNYCIIILLGNTYRARQIGISFSFKVHGSAFILQFTRFNIMNAKSHFIDIQRIARPSSRVVSVASMGRWTSWRQVRHACSRLYDFNISREIFHDQN